MNKWKYPSKLLKDMQKEYSLTDNNRLAIGLVKPNSKVLSIGCGPGREVRFLNRIGCDVTAIDIREDYLEASKEVEPNAEYILSDCVNYKSKDKFDYVICLWNTINAIPLQESRKRFIENSYNNLKDNGILIIVYKPIRSAYLYWLKFWNGFSYYPLWPNQVKYLFKDTGFKTKITRICNSRLLVAEK